MDGNYGTVRDLIWPRATAAIWLNYSFPTVMGRALRRTVRRAFTGEELYAGRRYLLDKWGARLGPRARRSLSVAREDLALMRAEG